MKKICVRTPNLFSNKPDDYIDYPCRYVLDHEKFMEELQLKKQLNPELFNPELFRVGKLYSNTPQNIKEINKKLPIYHFNEIDSFGVVQKDYILVKEDCIHVYMEKGGIDPLMFHKNFAENYYGYIFADILMTSIPYIIIGISFYICYTTLIISSTNHTNNSLINLEFSNISSFISQNIRDGLDYLSSFF